MAFYFSRLIDISFFLTVPLSLGLVYPLSGSARGRRAVLWCDCILAVFATAALRLLLGLPVLAAFVFASSWCIVLIDIARLRLRARVTKAIFLAVGILTACAGLEWIASIDFMNSMRKPVGISQEAVFAMWVAGLIAQALIVLGGDFRGFLAEVESPEEELPPPNE